MIKKGFISRTPTRIVRKGITRKDGVWVPRDGVTIVWVAGKPRRGSKLPHKRRKVKDGTWTLKKADKVFSGIIRARDGKCMHPKGNEHCHLLQNSHFFGRAIKSTRYDPDNCITLCWFHHYKSKDLGFEYQKQIHEKHGFDGQYTLFMKNHLGPERYIALLERSKISVKKNAAIKAFKESLLSPTMNTDV